VLCNHVATRLRKKPDEVSPAKIGWDQPAPR
jgi:hypothetical protein